MLWKLLSASSVAAGLLVGSADRRQVSHEIECDKVGFVLDGDRDFIHCAQIATTAPQSDGGPDDVVLLGAGDGLDATAPGLFRVFRVEPGRNAVVPELDLKSFLELFLDEEVDLTPVEGLGEHRNRHPANRVLRLD